MKKFILLAIFVISLSIIYLSCSKKSDDPNITSESSQEKISIQGNSINEIRPVEVDELLQIRDQIAYRVVQNNISFEELNKAFKDQNSERIRELLGFTKEEVSQIDSRLKILQENILKKYPQVKEQYEKRKKECLSCKEANLRSVYEKIHKKGFFKNDLKAGLITSNEEGGGAGCNWIPYTACLVACTTTGPVIYWFCAYVCVCSFCTGGPGCNTQLDQ
jgi:hypothetical protein